MTNQMKINANIYQNYWYQTLYECYKPTQIDINFLNDNFFKALVVHMIFYLGATRHVSDCKRMFFEFFVDFEGLSGYIFEELKDPIDWNEKKAYDIWSTHILNMYIRYS